MSGITLITGANKGIGYETARQLGKKGYTVLLGARDAKKGEEATERLKLEGIDVYFVPLDVTLDGSVRQAKEWIEAKFGKLDVLVNNAGIISHKGLAEEDIGEIKKVMETNFYGPMRTNAVFLPLLKKSSDARIINVSSGMGALEDLNGGYAAYRLSKAGLNAQTILLANELGSKVKVVAVCPGWVQTDMGGASAPRKLEKGAETIVWLAEANNIISGKFYRDKKEINW